MTEKNQVATLPLPATLKESQKTGNYAEELEKAEIMLGFRTKKNYSITELFKSYKVSYDVFDENKQWGKIVPLQEARNTLMRLQMEIMVGENKGHFNLKGLIPFKYICVPCSGTGEYYLFFKSSTPVPCKFCSGKGILKIVSCRDCEGTGRYKKPEGRVPINEICPTCKGTGKYKVKCRRCLGKGIFHKPGLAAKLEDTTACTKCRGRGFHIPKPEKKKHIHVPYNPVLSSDLGQHIKTSVISK